MRRILRLGRREDPASPRPSSRLEWRRSRQDQAAFQSYSMPVDPSPQSSEAPPPSSPSPALSSPPQCSPDFWMQAMEKLPHDEQIFLSSISAESQYSALQSDGVGDLIGLVLQRRQQCRDQSWTNCSLAGTSLSLSDVTSRIVTWLNKFKEIGDIVVQYDPVHAALPWAAVRFLLQCTVAYQDEMASSLVLLERTSRIVHRCQVFELLYNRETMGSMTVSGLEMALVELYATLLRGLAQVGKFFSQRSVARSFNPLEGSNLLSHLDAWESEVNKEATICESQKRVEEHSATQKQLQMLLSFERPLLRVDENVQIMLQMIEAGELADVRQWMSHIEYGLHHEQVRQTRTEGTCDWFLQRSQFYEWQSASSPVTLWLRGFPGTGKTYITSRVIDEVKETLANERNHEGFAFFYCNRSEPERREALSALRCYIRQLSSPSHLSDAIYPEFLQLRRDASLNASGWTLELCKHYLVKLFNFYPRTTLILDALDECSVENREILLDFFDSLSESASNPVKIFISSRPEGDIRQRLIHLPNIEIFATDNTGDIAKFINQSINRNGRWSSTLSRNEALKDQIVETLLEKSGGMFQWVKLQIEQLMNLRHEMDLRERLGKLPKDIKSAYDEIYDGIEQLPVYSRQKTLRALRWVMCAYEPLSTQLLLGAIRVDSESETIAEVDGMIDEEDLLDWCGNLLSLDSESGVWRPSHLSVVEYLETRCSMLEAHESVSMASLLLLMATPAVARPQENGDDITHPDHPLQDYVHYQWIRHVQTQESPEGNPKVARLLKAFLGWPGESSPSYQRWHRHISPNWRKWVSAPSAQRRILRGNIAGVDASELYPTATPIFTICRFSLYHLLKDWWENGSFYPTLMNLNSHDGLFLAATAGCNPICRNLVSRGANVNYSIRQLPSCSRLSSPILAAIDHGNLETVRLLLELGADANTAFPIGTDDSPLIAASGRGKLDIVRLLVEHGADVNAAFPFRNEPTALIAASYRGKLGVVKLLVEHGADVNAAFTIGNETSALVAACLGGDLDIVKFLVEQGADINLEIQSSTTTALETAKQCRRAEVVEYLERTLSEQQHRASQ